MPWCNNRFYAHWHQRAYFGHHLTKAGFKVAGVNSTLQQRVAADFFIGRPDDATIFIHPQSPAALLWLQLNLNDTRGFDDLAT